MSGKTCGEVCQCIASGEPGCQISEKAGRQERYLAARDFLDKTRREGQPGYTERPGTTVWDMLPEGFSIDGLAIDAGDLAHLRAREAHAKELEVNDPLVAAVVAMHARYAQPEGKVNASNLETAHLGKGSLAEQVARLGWGPR